MRSKRSPRPPQPHLLFVFWGVGEGVGGVIIGWVRGVRVVHFRNLPPHISPLLFWVGVGEVRGGGGLLLGGWRVRVVDFRNPPPHSPSFFGGDKGGGFVGWVGGAGSWASRLDRIHRIFPDFRKKKKKCKTVNALKCRTAIFCTFAVLQFYTFTVFKKCKPGKMHFYIFQKLLTCKSVKNCM